MDGKRFIDSLRGLVAVTDSAFRLVFHFANNVESSDRDPDAAKRITNVADEIQQLSGLLHRLALLATGLERDGADLWFGEPVLPVSLPPRLVGCHQTLAKLEKSLGRRDVSAELKRRENGHCEPFLHLRWPFTRAWTLDLIEELERHKQAVADAVGNICPGASLESLWGSFMDSKKNYADARIEMSQLTRYHGLKTTDDCAAARFFTRADYYPPLERHLRARNPLSTFPFLESEEFAAWTAAGGSKLWLTGRAGTGKTVLAAAMVDAAARVGRRDDVVAFHFCDFSDLRTHSPESVAGSLACQVAFRNGQAMEMLDRYQKELQPERGKAGKRPSVERLRDILVKMSSLFHNVMIVVDGVNEAGDEVGEVTRLLVSLASEKLSIALISRDQKNIRDIVQDDFRHIEVQTTQEEIGLFTAAELQKKISSGRLVLPDSHAVDEAVRKIRLHPETT